MWVQQSYWQQKDSESNFCYILHFAELLEENAALPQQTAPNTVFLSLWLWLVAIFLGCSYNQTPTENFRVWQLEVKEMRKPFGLDNVSIFCLLKSSNLVNNLYIHNKMEHDFVTAWPISQPSLVYRLILMHSWGEKWIKQVVPRKKQKQRPPLTAI